ncbi:MAG: phage tail tape measure protein [Candidatus Omnitrophica bacterium]|nr:phage tail tape measure protein [Candidatus Omnitrophota bacterium]
MPVKAGDAVWIIGGDTSNLRKALLGARGQVTSMAKSVGQISRTIGTGFTAAGTAVTASFAGMVKFGGDFKASIREIASLGVKDLSTIEEGVKRLSVRFGKDLVEVSKGAYQAISATGFDGAEAVSLLEQATKAAVAGVSDVTSAVTLGTGVMNAWGRSVDDIGGIFDEAFIAVKNGVTTFPELAASVGQLSPVFAAAKLGSDEMFASITAVTKAGIGTSETVTGLKAAISNIIKPTAEAKELAKELGLDFSSTALAAQGFGGFLERVKEATGGNVEQMSVLFSSVEGLNTVLALSGSQAGAFRSALEEMRSGVSATDAAFNQIIADNPSFAFQQIWQAVKVLATEVTDALAPVLGGLTIIVSGLTSRIQEWIKENPELFQTLTTVTAGIAAFMAVTGPVLVILPSLVSGFGLFSGAISAVTGVVPLMLAGIKAAIGVFPAMVSAVAGVGSAVWGMLAAVASIGTSLAAMGASFLVFMGPFIAGAAAIGAAGYLIVDNWKGIGEAAHSMWAGIKRAWDAGSANIMKSFGTLGDAFALLWRNFATAFSSRASQFGEAFHRLKEGVLLMWEGIKGYFSKGKRDSEEALSLLKEGSAIAWTAIKEISTTAAQAMWAGILDSFKQGTDGSLSVLDLFRRSMGEFFDGLRSVISEAFGLFISGAWNTTLDALMNGLFGFLNFIDWVSWKIIDAFKNLAEKASEYWSQFKDAVTGPIDTVKGKMEEFWQSIKGWFGHSTWIDAFENLSKSANLYFGEFKDAIVASLGAVMPVLRQATPLIVLAATQMFGAGEQLEKGGIRAVVGGQQFLEAGVAMEKGGEFALSGGKSFRVAGSEIEAAVSQGISPALRDVLASIQAQNEAMAEAAQTSRGFAEQLTSDWGRIGDAATEAGERASQVTSLFEENSEALRRAGVAGVTNLSDYAAQLAYLQERLGMTQDELLQQHLADMTRTLRAGVITWGEFGSAIYLQTFGEFLADLAEQNGFAAGQIEEQQRALSEDLLALTQHLQSGMTSTWSSMMGNLVDTTSDGGDLITVAMEGMARRSREALDSISATAVVSAGAVARSAESIREEVSRAIESVRGLPGGLVTVGLAGEARAGGGVTSHPIVKVGERGPELVALPAGSRVMSHADMMAAVRGFASGGIVGLQDIVRSQRMTDQFRAMQDTFQGIHFGQTREERRAEARAWVAGIEWANAVQLRNQMEAEIRAIVRQAQVQAEAQRRIAALGLPTSGGGTTTGGGGTTSAGSLYVPSSGFGMLDSGFSAMLSALSPMPGSSGSGGSGAQGNVTISGPLVHVEHVDASNPADVDMLLERISDVFLQRLSQAGLSVNVGVA